MSDNENTTVEETEEIEVVDTTLEELVHAMEREEKQGGSRISSKDLEAVYEVPVQISAVLGRATMPVLPFLFSHF